LTLTERQQTFGRDVVATLRGRGIRAELDDRNEKLGYKIRQAQLEKIPYMLVIGDREAAEGKVAARLRSGEQLPPMTVDEIVARVTAEAKEPTT